jgi:hypothetical protein
MAAGSTYTPIATQTLGSSASTVTFNSIPSIYTDLVLVANSITAANASFKIQFNGDTGSNYSSTLVYGNGTSATSLRTSNQTSINIIGRSGSNGSSNIINIQNYSNATTYKTTLGRGGADITIATVGLWRSTSAITSINVANDSGGNFLTGSTFTLYGIAAA